MKILLKICLVLSVTTASMAEELGFPRNPNLKETPGRLCANSKVHRYPENIPYCERNVDSYTKNAVIQNYDLLLGYKIRTMKRTDFKIDHLIPLCAGGANSEDNLWPQHKSIYEITDPVEPLLCQKMLDGRLKQADAVKLIIQAKTNLDQVPAIIKKLNSL